MNFLYRKLAVLLVLLAACGGQSPAAAPTPQVFDSTASQIDTFTRFFHEGCHFGGAVDIDGDLIVAGAPCWSSFPGYAKGSAYVLRRTSTGELQLEATLTASDRDDGFQYDQHFGDAVALDGSLIAVGAPGYDDPKAGDNTGAVYLFKYDGSDWVETGKLIPSRPKPGAKIGRALAFDGDLIAAGGSPEAGSVSIFTRAAGGWRETASLPVPPTANGDLPYVLLDLYEGTLALSASPGQDPLKEWGILPMAKPGMVTLYERDAEEWKQVFQTPPLDAVLYRMYSEAPFGLPVSLGGDAGQARWLAVGRPGYSPALTRYGGQAGVETLPGTVSVYERGRHGWTAQAELRLAPGELVPGALPFFSSDPAAAFFGAYVELEGSRLAVVSTFANTVDTFERQDQDWVYRYRVTPGTENGDDFQRRTVALSSDQLLMGSPGELGGGEVLLFNLSH